MNIEACDKGTGKKQNITIKNDKGRLSAEDIERMIQEGEKFKDEDNNLKQKIESKNNLESLLYQFREAISNDEIKNKITPEEIKQLKIL